MPPYPSLYQINTRVLLARLSKQLNRPATLDDIPNAFLDECVTAGFEWLYFLGIWQTGTIAPQISRSNPIWLEEYRHTLPDLKDEDICGSCFAVVGYKVHSDMGGNTAAERLRDRLHQRGVKLMLDFVPNHTAPDHPWVQAYPDFYVQGTEEQLQKEPQNYCRVRLPSGDQVFAYGRDPYFDGWCDTLQLNYGNPELCAAQREELLAIAQLCDGVRCDMAMLILPEIFQRTWGIATEPFWPGAIEKVRSQHPDFVFMAEVYWDLEWTLQQQGFNYTYDKRLYDRLREQHAHPVREHFWADLGYQQKSARFLENHDESRAAATFPAPVHEAAAVLTFLCPGLRFFHQGQFEGFQKRISVHLQRGPDEPTNSNIRGFYKELLTCLKDPILHNGTWQLLECVPAWEGNWTGDCFTTFDWKGDDGTHLLAIVNYAPHQSQCYLKHPECYKGLAFRNILSSQGSIPPEGVVLGSTTYFDMPAWAYHVLKLE